MTTKKARREYQRLRKLIRVRRHQQVVQKHLAKKNSKQALLHRQPKALQKDEEQD